MLQGSDPATDGGNNGTTENTLIQHIPIVNIAPKGTMVLTESGKEPPEAWAPGGSIRSLLLFEQSHALNVGVVDPTFIACRQRVADEHGARTGHRAARLFL